MRKSIIIINRGSSWNGSSELMFIGRERVPVKALEGTKAGHCISRINF